MRSFVRKKGFNYLIVAAVAVVAPWLVGLAGAYWMHMLVIVAIFSIMAVGLNLIMGYTGQINIAQAAFFGLGAYGSGLLMIHFGINWWVALVLGGIIAVVFALFIGLVSLRLRGTYFAICTMAFLMVLASIFINWMSLTGGDSGLGGIPSASIGGFVFEPSNRLAWYYLVVFFLLLAMFIVDRVINSRIGRAFIAIRENEDLAKSTGINTMRYKVLSFCIATFFAGISGALYASYLTCMTPADCAILPSLMVIASCVIGGLGTMIGPVVGTAIVYFLPEFLRPIEAYYMLIFGFIMVIVVIFAPNGLMGAIKSLQARLRTRGSREEVRA